MIKHKYDVTGRAYAQGKSAEDDFVSLMETKGWIVTNSTREENMIGHFDYHIEKGDVKIKVEVKAEKRISSKDTDTQTDWIWIEFQAVNGSPGWLYGQADYLAFQREGKYHFIDRKALVTIAETLTKTEYVSRSVDAKYRYYRRWKRNDLLTMIHFNDIKDYCIEL